MNMQELGKYIAKLREEKELTQEMLANYVGVTRQAVSRWETGKSIPDVETIPVLAKELGTTTEELLSHAMGDKEFASLEELKKKRVRKKDSNKETSEEQKNEIIEDKPITISKTDVYNIMLNLYDDAKRSKNKSKKYFIMLLISSLIILVCIILFIITSLYNAVSIYNINGSNDSINVSNGIFVITRDKIYFDLGTITNNTNKEINDIELYYYNKDNNKSSVFKIEGYNKDKNIILHDFIGYGEYFNYDELDYILKSLTLELTIEDEAIETVDLEIVKENYRKILTKREQPAGIGENTEIKESEDSKKLEKFVKEYFEPTGDGYSYSIKYKGNVIDYIYLDKCLSIDIINKKELIESWLYDSSDNSLSHYKSNKELLIEDEYLNLKNNNKDNQEKIDEFYKYLNLLKSEFSQ